MSNLDTSSKAQRQLDGRTLYVLMFAAQDYLKEGLLIDSQNSVKEIQNAIANAKYLLEYVKLEVVSDHK